MNQWCSVVIRWKEVGRESTKQEKRSSSAKIPTNHASSNAYYATDSRCGWAALDLIILLHSFFVGESWIPQTKTAHSPHVPATGAWIKHRILHYTKKLENLAIINANSNQNGVPTMLQKKILKIPLFPQTSFKKLKNSCPRLGPPENTQPQKKEPLATWVNPHRDIHLSPSSDTDSFIR